MSVKVPIITVNASGRISAISQQDVTGASTHGLLSATHDDAEVASPTRGDIVIATSIPKWAPLAIGAAKKYLRSNGSDPDWSALLIGDLPAGGTWDLGGTDLSLSNGALKLATAGKGYYERARATPMGEWTQVTYNAANFTAKGSMTWTVESADQVSYKYTLIGETMFVGFTLNGTSVGGVASDELRIAIPGGYLALNSDTLGAIRAYDNGSDTVGFCGVVAGASYIRCWRGGFTNWSATSTNATSLQGLAIFEIQ